MRELVTGHQGYLGTVMVPAESKVRVDDDAAVIADSGFAPVFLCNANDFRDFATTACRHWESDEMVSTSDGVSAVQAADLDYLTGQLRSELPRLDGQRLLITGGAGFLGYYLVQGILRWNDTMASAPVQVTVLDNFRRGAPAWLRDLADRPDLVLLTHDVTLPFPAGVPPVDYVIHAAGIASPGLYRQIPIETMDANVEGLRRLLDRAVAQQEAGHPVSGFLFYSSSEIYGDPVASAIPTPETYRGNVSCTGPRACYDESKRYGETLAVNFARVHGLPVSIARPFNNYGPGMKINDGRVIADFCSAIVDDEDIVILSDGSPTRTFCYVADAVIGYYKVLLSGQPGEPYNIGTEEPEISMAALANLIAESWSHVPWI